MNHKKRDTVKLVGCINHPDHKFNGETGVVRLVDSDGYIYLTKRALCGCNVFIPNEYKIIRKKEVKMERTYEFSKKGLKVGDIVVDNGGYKIKIIEVLQNSFAISNWDDFNNGCYWRQFNDAIKHNWTIEQPVKPKSKATLKKIAEAKKQKVEIDKFLEEQGEI